MTVGHRSDVVPVNVPIGRARRIADGAADLTDLDWLVDAVNAALPAFDHAVLVRACGIEFTGDGIRMPIEVMAVDAMMAWWWYRVLPVVQRIDMEHDMPTMVTL
jgi:hypothetical protein